MILVYPPVAKPCEPPAGIAKLAGALNTHGIKFRSLDANLEGALYLMQRPLTASDTWSKRAFRNLSKNLSDLKNLNTYYNPGRYKRAVMDVNRVLKMSALKNRVTLGLVNFQHHTLSPLRSEDLIYAAETSEQSPFFPYFEKRLRELIEKEEPSIVGFSLSFLSQAIPTFAMAGFLRKNHPNITLILGGGLVTSWTKSPMWKNPFKGLLDFLISGPGEDSLLSIIGIKRTNKDHFSPDYGSLPIHEYLSPGLILPYSASHGCYWNKCSFCPERTEKNPYIQLSAQEVTVDLGRMTKKMNPILIHLLDNSIHPTLLKALLNDPPGAPWYGFARITPHLADLDFCMALKRSGCVMLKLGLESGDQEVLDQMQKGIDLKVASSVLKNLKKAGIATYIYFLFGTPIETGDNAKKTLEFTVKHSNEIGFLNLALFNMPVASPESKRLETTSFYQGDLALYTDFIHPKGWNRKCVREFLSKEFKRHGAVSAILKKDPSFFTSNHAPFFVGDFTKTQRGLAPLNPIG